MNLFIISLAFFFNTEVTKEPVIEPAIGSSYKTLPNTVNKGILLQLVNDVRKKGCQCGDTYYKPVPALKWNEQLASAAYEHSTDMFRRKYFAHKAPDGANGGVRIKKTGYDWAAFGENIAMGYTSEREVVEGWLKSPGHCKNIMNRIYTEMGVARYGKYWTQEFAKKMN